MACAYNWKDISTKAIFSNQRNCVNLFNGIMFNGEEILSPDTLLFGPTDLCSIKQNGTDVDIEKLEVDVCKLLYRGKSLPRIVLHIENQTRYDGSMKQRIDQYHKCIKEELIRTEIIDESDPVVFLTIVITYDNSGKNYLDTGEMPDEIIKAMDQNENRTIIKEFRPMQQTFDFTGDLKIMFDCIRMNRKKSKKQLEKYVTKNLAAINNNFDLAYYLRELTGIDAIWPDPTKIKGVQNMSILDDAYDKWYGKGHTEGFNAGHEKGFIKGHEKGITECIIRMKNYGCSENQIAEMLNLSIEKVEAILKEEKAG